ncbi:MAG TPA: HIT family protein [Bacillota bacterium]|nr:HIT family protein [Bacillota bacterium]
MVQDCPFCSPPAEQIVLSNACCYARYDRYPVSPGHLLIIPFRHVADFFNLTEEERKAAFELLWQAKAKLESELHPDGFNVGVNVGETAGQTVMHVHIHLIPRYVGDMERPEGGVRGVIPEKRVYRKP